MPYVPSGMKRIKNKQKNLSSRKVKLRYQTLKGSSKMSKTIAKHMCGYLYSRDINLPPKLFVPHRMAKTS